MNLLQARPTVEDLEAILVSCPPRSPLPRADDRQWGAAFGNPLTASILQSVLQRGLAEREEALPALSDELYADYGITGNRLRFEKPYFERRRRLARAAIGLLAEGGEGWRLSFLAKLEAIFSEASWALPAHVAVSSGKDPRCLDLFAAETANLMAECLSVFTAQIPEPLGQAICSRLRKDFFENYRDHADSTWWTSHSSNWNAVCHQGIIGAALQVEEDSRLLAGMLHLAARKLPSFLSGYGDDGGCTEGPSYWEYGFGWFCLLNEQLETRTAGTLSLVEGDEKIKAIARYGSRVSLRGGKLVNFADAMQGSLIRPSLFQYLGQRFDLPDCRRQASVNYGRAIEEGIDCDMERGDLLFWLRFFLQSPERLDAVDESVVDDVYFPDLQVWVVRARSQNGNDWEVAAKGGHNAEHHNHNDLGSFLVNIDGIPLITEIGSPEYTGAFFTDKRYEFLAARTLGHSLPIINGQEQAAGIQHKADVTRAETGSASVAFEVDLTRAYPESARCKRYVRKLSFDKQRGVLEWSDEIAMADIGAVESAVITDSSDVEIENSQRAIIRKAGVALELSCGEGVRWSRVEIHGYQGHGGEGCEIRRLVLEPDRPQSEANFTVRIQALP